MNKFFLFTLIFFSTTFNVVLAGDESSVAEEPAVEVAQLVICSSDSDQGTTSEESASDSDQADPIIYIESPSDSSEQSPVSSDAEAESNQPVSPDLESDSSPNLNAELSPDSTSESSSESNSSEPQFDDDYFFGTAGIEVYKEFEESIDDLVNFKQGALDRKNNLLEDLFNQLMDLLIGEASFQENAYIYFQKLSIADFIATWTNTVCGYGDDAQERDLLEEKAVKALDKLEQIIQHFCSKEIIEEDMLNKVEVVTQRIKKTRDLIITDILVDHGLNALFVYHFSAFKRKNATVDQLFFALLDIFVYGGSFGSESTLTFDEEDKKTLTEEWEKTEHSFEHSRNQRAEFKSTFFQALIDLEKIIECFRVHSAKTEEAADKIENTLRILRETRKYVVEVHCRRF